MQSKIFSTLIFIILVCACTTAPKKTIRPLTRRERQLLYYQKLRQSQWQEISRKSGYHKNKKITIKSQQKREKVQKRISSPKPKTIPVDPHEQRIEIEQILSFYCMKKRIKECDGISTQVYENCLQKFNPGDKQLTYCIKKALH